MIIGMLQCQRGPLFRIWSERAVERLAVAAPVPRLLSGPAAAATATAEDVSRALRLAKRRRRLIQ